jgi:hypothetical protein
MKNALKLFGVIALGVVVMFSIVACKGKSNGSSGAPAAVSASAAPSDKEKSGGSSDTPAAAPAAASASAAPSSIKDWDSFLKEYESFLMSEYVPMVQKMKTGDKTVYATLQQTQTKFAEWGRNMSNFAKTAGEPTDAQKKKLLELSEKIKEATDK